MAIQCASQLANTWMAAFDNCIKGKSLLYKSYMDVVLQVNSIFMYVFLVRYYFPPSNMNGLFLVLQYLILSEIH